VVRGVNTPEVYKGEGKLDNTITEVEAALFIVDYQRSQLTLMYSSESILVAFLKIVHVILTNSSSYLRENTSPSAKFYKDQSRPESNTCFS
jgi:hypothetical protein